MIKLFYEARLILTILLINLFLDSAKCAINLGTTQDFEVFTGKKKWYPAINQTTTEKSLIQLFAGYMVYRLRYEQPEYLLLRSRSGTYHWAFPKGRIFVEKAENETTVALRQLTQRTGINEEDIETVPKFAYHASFEVGGFTKNMIFYLARLVNAQRRIMIHYGLYKEYRWVTFNEAPQFLKHEDQVKAVTAAEEFLMKPNVTG